MSERKYNGLGMKNTVHTEIQKEYGHERLRELIVVMAPLACSDMEGTCL